MIIFVDIEMHNSIYCICISHLCFICVLLLLVHYTLNRTKKIIFISLMFVLFKTSDVKNGSSVQGEENTGNTHNHRFLIVSSVFPQLFYILCCKQQTFVCLKYFWEGILRMYTCQYPRMGVAPNSKSTSDKETCIYFLIIQFVKLRIWIF